MKRAKWALLLLLALVLPLTARAQLGPLPPVSEWREYREPDDGFIVRVPNAVKAREWRDGGLPANYYLTGNPLQTFSVIVVRWPAGMRGGLDAPAVAASMAVRILGAMKPEKVERDETQDCGEGIPGRVLAARLPDDLVYTARICVTPANIYRVEAVVAAMHWEETQPNAKAFLDSFKVVRP
ncbi:MAG: hypothetical protein KIT36_20275 [Alphaproteobacteria bacterium]|nr:hypothetical protein [Alphaproteobacteria bacterium]